MKNDNKRFVTSLSLFKKMEDVNYIKKHGGFLGAIKVPGIDIFHYKETDRENAYRAFGNAISIVDIPTKYVFLGCKPEYGTQKANIARHELLQKNPYRKELLARERSWLEYYEEKEEARFSFIIFLAQEKEDIFDSVNKYVSCLSRAKITAKICGKKELVQLYKTLLRGGND